MSHEGKTRDQLVSELEEARKRVSELESLAAGGSRAGAGRSRTEKELADAHMLLNAVVEQSPMPMAIATPDGRLWQFNQACAELLGIEGDPSVIPGASLAGLPRSWKIFDQDGKEVAEDGLPLPLTFQGVTTRDRVLRVVRSDGTEGWVSANAAPLTGAGGEPIAGFLAMPDITERVRAVEALRDSEFLLAASQRVARLGSYSLDIHHGVWSSSPVLERIFGVDAEYPRDLEGWLQIVHPDDRSVMDDYFATNVLGNRERFDREYRILRIEDGVERWVHGLGELEVDADGNPVRMFGTIQDVTKRKQTEEALRAGEERANALLQAVPDLMFRLDDRGVLLDYRAEDSRLHVRGGETIVGKSMRDILPTELVEVLHRHISLTLDTGEMQTFEYQLTVGSGPALRDFEARMVRSGGKEVTAIVRDVTERKVMEAQKVDLEKQLLHAQRLESIGTLAGGIAHDFNNILTPIMGYAEILQDQIKPEEAASYVERILGATQRAKELVERILLFSQQVEKERKPVRIQLIVEEAIQLLRPSIPTTISIEESIDPSCNPVLADDTQIHQVVVNLCTNAFQAMEVTGGTLRIEVEQVEVGAEIVRLRPNLSEGEYVRLSVRDTGPGMEEGTLARVFEPFFTTKPVDKGTGMGLSVVHGIMISHQGDVLVESAPGEGTVFHVYLPTMGPGTETAPEDLGEMSGGVESILVVDDDELVANVVMAMLERLGYRVTMFTSSHAALDEFSERKDRYDLVISDLTMPHMTGSALAQRIQRLRPGIPFIIMTGYGENLERDIDTPGVTKFIAKPITLQKLGSTVRAALDA